MNSRFVRGVASMAVFATVLSCGSGEGVAPPTAIAPRANTPASDSTLLAGLYASGPVAGERLALDRIGVSGSVAANVEVSWISLVPGTIPDGTTATIVNRRTAERDTALVVGGGFDPFPILAIVGDTIEVEVSRTGKPGATALLSMAARPGPRLVRSRPPRGQTDTPLNTVISLVFSEPLDPASVNPTSVTLAAAGAPVAGTVRILPGPGYAIEFTPNTWLAPSTTYALTVSGVATLAGAPLDAPASITFTTSAATGPDSVVAVTFDRHSATSRPGDAIQFFVSLTYASGDVNSTFNQALSWSSSAPDVAYVDVESGAVTGVGPGTALITGTYYGGVKDTARVTIDPTTIPVGAIVATLCSRLGQECGLYAVDPDGSRGRFITSSDVDLDPVWSPDGRWIAFESQRACNRATTRLCHNDLYVMRGDGSGIGADSSGLRSLTAGAGLDVGGISWSPDGNRLVFAASPFPSVLYLPEALYVVNADGTGLQRIFSAPPGSSVSWPDWSPDGSRIVYELVMPGDTSVIGVVNADGTNDAHLTIAWDTNGDHRPRWSPDGKRIAFTRASGSAPTDVWQVFVMDADGSNVVQITHDPKGTWYPAWSPDGGSFALFFGALGNLGIMNVDGTGRSAVPIQCCGYEFTSAFSWRRAAAAAAAPSRSTPSTNRVRP